MFKTTNSYTSDSWLIIMVENNDCLSQWLSDSQAVAVQVVSGAPTESDKYELLVQG